MNVTLSRTEKLSKMVGVDVALLVAICVVPALSHLLAVPLYMMNPMLLCLLAGMLLVRDRRNAYVLAVALPLVSMLTTGMPVPMKALCMVPELLTVVALFHLLERRAPVFVALVAAILAGKVVFYALKALLIAPVLLVETQWWMQLATAVLYAGLFSLILTHRTFKNR